MRWARRETLVGGGAFGIVGRAAASPANGAVAFVVTATGLGGLMMAGEDGAAIDPDLAWHIGSNTKAMTALLHARLVETGHARWGADVASLFPDLAVHAAWRDVPVEALTAHAAGLNDATITPAWLDERRRDPADVVAQRRGFAAAALARPPGADLRRYRYANANFVVLGAAIEAALGMPWEDAMRRHLFAPLRLRGAGFGAPTGLWGRRETPGGPVPVDPAGVADNPAVLWPSGGVHLPPGDYARFLRMFLNEGAPLIAPATLARLLTPPAPALPYAGGWLRDGQALTHNGSNTFWFATATIDRVRGRAVAAIANRGGIAGKRTVTALVARLR